MSSRSSVIPSSEINEANSLVVIMASFQISIDPSDNTSLYRSIAHKLSHARTLLSYCLPDNSTGQNNGYCHTINYSLLRTGSYFADEGDPEYRAALFPSIASDN